MIDPPIEVSVVHTGIGHNAHRTDALLDLRSARRLEEGARRLTGRHIEMLAGHPARQPGPGCRFA
jgi:hypothetical protein